jgi:hypothetical protein
MQKPKSYSLPDEDSKPSILEESPSNAIPHWHKLIVSERLRTRNKADNYDMSWEEIMQRLTNQHENI